MSAATAASGAMAEGTAGRGGGKRKLVLLVLPLLLVVAGGGAWFAGLLDPWLGGKPAEAAKESAVAKHEAPTFVDLPDLIANLNGGGRRTSYVKLKAKLELAQASDLPAVQAAQPRVMDLLQTYLREMRPEELRGSAGTYRLREELLARIGPAVAPAQVRDVLFVELLVQ